MFLRIVAGSDHIGCGMTAATMVHCVLSIYVCFVCDLKETGKTCKNHTTVFSLIDSREIPRFLPLYYSYSMTLVTVP